MLDEEAEERALSPEEEEEQTNAAQARASEGYYGRRGGNARPGSRRGSMVGHMVLLHWSGSCSALYGPRWALAAVLL